MSYRGSAKSLIILTLITLLGCHRIENKAKSVIISNINDPSSIQLRNVHYSDVDKTVICGEFNEKNSFGGYVGFKPFEISTAYKDALNILDDKSDEYDRNQYYLVCGDKIQREIAEANTQEELSQLFSVTPTPGTSLATQMFVRPKLPTPIEQMSCHMGECEWEQIVDIEDVEMTESEVLRAVRSRSTTTETAEGRDYPTQLDPGLHVEWSKSPMPSYVLCSLSRPTSFYWDGDAKSFLKTPLHVVSPYGFEQSAVAEYDMACHGVKPGSGHPEQLGYVDRSDDESQTHVADPKKVFGRTSSFRRQ